MSGWEETKKKKWPVAKESRQVVAVYRESERSKEYKSLSFTVHLMQYLSITLELMVEDSTCGQTGGKAHIAKYSLLNPGGGYVSVNGRVFIFFYVGSKLFRIKC